MATFIEPKFPVTAKPPRRTSGNNKKPPLNHTLENVAEEVLNGMFCHYEPPDPERSKPKKKPYRSILRQPKAIRENGRKSSDSLSKRSGLARRVRWVDETEMNPDQVSPAGGGTEIAGSDGINRDDVKNDNRPVMSPIESQPNGCNVAQACFDAGLEVGCYGNGHNDDDAAAAAPTPKMNAQEAIAVARSKSPRHNPNRTTPLPDIVYDDEGTPRYATPMESSSTIHPPPPTPPPPPPPNKKEIFFPELCGVRINCMDDDTLLASTESSSFDKSGNGSKDSTKSSGSNGNTQLRRGRHNNTKDMDDPDNSIIYEDDDDESETSDDEEDEYHDAIYRRQRRLTSTQPTPVQKPQPQQQPPKKTIRQVIEEYQDDDDSEDDKGADWENTSAVSSTFFRRVWSRNKAKGNNAINTPLDTIKETKASSVPVANVSRKNRTKALNDFDPVEMDRSETQPKTTNFGFTLKRSQSPPRTLSATENSDWDNNIPIVQSGSAENVAHPEVVPPPQQKREESTIEKEPSAQPTRRRSRSLDRQSRMETMRRSLSPTNRRRSSSKSKSVSKAIAAVKPPPSHSAEVRATQQASPQTHQPNVPEQPVAPEASQSLFHPAHPLVNEKHGRGLDKDDMLERQSYITAHRDGFGDVGLHSSAQLQDDALERQSMITAHRIGFDKTTSLLGRPKTTSARPSDRRHQSHAPRVERGLPLSQPQPSAPPDMATRPLQNEQQSPGYIPQMSHDDMLERMSFITANRNGVEQATSGPSPRNWRGGSTMNSSQPKAQNGGSPGRVRSPFRRSRSFEREYDSIIMQQQPGYNVVPSYASASNDTLRHQPMQDRRSSLDARMQQSSHNPAALSDRSNAGAIPGNDNLHQQNLSHRGISLDPRSHQSHYTAGSIAMTLPDRGDVVVASGNKPSQSVPSFPPAFQYESYTPSQFHHAGYGVDPSRMVHLNSMQMMHPPINGGPVPMMPNPLTGGNDVGSGGNGPVAPQHWTGQSVPTGYAGYNSEYAMLPNNGGLAGTSSELQPSPPQDEPKAVEPEPTWEERTRQAWERLRGGMAAFVFDTPKEEQSAATTSTGDNSTPHPPPDSQVQTPQPSNYPPLSPGPSIDMYNLMQSPSHPREQFVPEMNPPPLDTRRVSFGAPQQMIYYDDQDENQTMMSYPSYPGQIKKKKKFRGTKLVTGVFGKMKNSLGKVSMSRSSSSDSNPYLRSAASSDSNVYSNGHPSPQLSEWEMASRYHGTNQQVLPAPTHPLGYTSGPHAMYASPNTSYANPDNFQRHQMSRPNHAVSVNNGYQFVDPRGKYGYRN